MHLSREEAIMAIEDFLNHQGGKWDWDDFTSIPLKDPELEKIRKECLHLPDKFPPTQKGQYCSEAGLNRLREILTSLR